MSNRCFSSSAVSECLAPLRQRRTAAASPLRVLGPPRVESDSPGEFERAQWWERDG